MLLVRNALRIFSPGLPERSGDLLVESGLVSDGAPAIAESADVEVLDASGAIVTPGLINAHHHLLQSAFRTLPGTRGVPMREWLPTMAAAYDRAGIDPGLAGLSARVGLAESLLFGVTTVADHQLNWPEGPVELHTEIALAVADAASRLGARLVFVRGSARDVPESAAESADQIAARLAPEHGGLSADAMVQVALGPAGVHSDEQATFRAFAALAQQRGLRRRTQANEVVDVEVSMRDYGRRPLELLDDWGWLAPDVTLAHLCAITDAEVQLLSERGVSATHAPGCDVPMGWGISPVHRLRAAGLAVGMGTSGGGSNDAGNLLADARLAMQVSALVGPQLDAREVLEMATQAGAEGLGRGDLGTLRVGVRGDLCVWDVSGVADVGVADPVAGLLWANPGRRPRHVVVNGEVVVRDGVLVREDERELAAQLRERLA